MRKIKEFIKEKKMAIAVVSILLICSIAIAFGVYAQITHREQIKSEEERLYANYESLKSDFQNIFTNTINVGVTADKNINYNELLFTAHNIKDEKNGKYKIQASLPEFKGDTETQQKINKEIYDTFGAQMLKIAQNAKINSTYSLDYAAYVNKNILSLVIMCKYKDGENAQRKIIQCYNYDIENQFSKEKLDGKFSASWMK